MGRPRILATLPDTPWPINAGKRLRQWAHLRALCEVGDVDVLVLFSSEPDISAPPGLPIRRFKAVSPTLRSPAAAVARVGRARPWAIARKRWGIARASIATDFSDDYDLVWFGGSDHALELRSSVRARHMILDMDDVETEKLRGFLELPPTSAGNDRITRLQRRVELPMWARIERKLGKWADRVVVCSKEEAAVLGLANAVVVPNCYPPPEMPVPITARGTCDMLMIGSYENEQNIDAAEFAALDVLPLIRERVPTARLRLVGRGGKEALPGIVGQPGLDIVGPVAETSSDLLAAAAVVVPMRWGGGTRIKILEAFAYGTPVVSTSLGCAGYPVVDGRELLIRDTAAAFAQGCVELLQDPALGVALATAGRELYKDSYTPDAVARTVQGIVTDVLS